MTEENSNSPLTDILADYIKTGYTGVDIDLVLEELAKIEIAQSEAENKKKALDASEREIAARRLYLKWIDKQGIHCNRFPSWDELSGEVRDEWRDKASIQ